MIGDNLARKTSAGFLWVALENAAVNGISFILGIIMARLLTPADFGLVAVLSIFILLAQTLAEAGLSVSLIQNLERSEKDFSTAFICNLTGGVICYTIIWLVAPAIAEFYSLPRLSVIIRVLGLTVPFNALGIVPQTRFDINMEFRTPMIVSVVSLLLSGIVGVYMASRGLGVWAIVVQQTLYCVLRSLILLSLAIPKPLFSSACARNLLRAGFPMLCSRFINMFCENIYPAALGKVGTVSQLGNYSKANSFVRLPADAFSSILQRVTLPSLSSLQDDAVRFRNAYGKMIRISAFCFFPVMAVSAAVCMPLVVILLTDKWTGLVPLFRILALSFMLWPIHSLNLNALVSKGWNKLFLKLEIIKMLLRLIVLSVTLHYGVVAVCWGIVAVSWISLGVNMTASRSMLGIKMFRQFSMLLPSLSCSVSAGIATWYIQSLLCGYVLQLTAGVATGLTVYIVMSRAFNNHAITETKDLILSMCHKYVSK